MEIKQAKHNVLFLNAGIYALCMMGLATGAGVFAASVFVQAALNFLGGVVLLFFPKEWHKEAGKTMLLSALLLLVIGVPVCFVIGISSMSMNFH